MLINIRKTMFISNIRFLRKRYTLSVRALSKLIGISPVTLRDLETGCGFFFVKEHTVDRLCAVFNTDRSTLLYTNMRDD